MIQIGTSGWSYAHWEGVLYPPGLPPSQRLAAYVAQFPTVELNASYYRWPRDGTFTSWQRRLPALFRMTVKAPGYLTHRKRLYEPERWVARIRAGMQRLGEKAGILLVQLSPRMPRDDARLAYFLSQIAPWPRVAVEFRHPGWHDEAIFRLLEQYRAAYCVMSGAHLPCILRATTDFVFGRLHGPDPHHLYGGSYADDDLRWWADRIREWETQGRDVWLYFNNDGDGNAVRNARALRYWLWG